MKKLIVLSAVFASLTFVSCGDKKADADATAADSTAVEAPVVEETPAAPADSTAAPADSTAAPTTEAPAH